MNIRLHIDPSRIFRWHCWLTDSLVKLPGCTVSITFSPGQRPLPRSCAMLFQLERLIYGLSGQQAIDPIDRNMITVSHSPNPADVIIDTANDPDLPTDTRILTPYYNGLPGETGIVSALINQKPLIIEVRDSANPDAWLAQPSVIDRDIVLYGLDNILSCTVGMIIKSLTVPAEIDRTVIKTSAKIVSMPRAFLHMAETFTNKVFKRIERLTRGNTAWTVAWRSATIPILSEGKAAFTVLPDDGKRFYADPFPFRHQGRDFIFVEEFPYKSGRGHISVSEIVNGRASRPVPVLRESHHLSYPSVFQHGGEIWMIPESGEVHGVNLYRAENFPYQWKPEGKLIDVDGYDATLMLPENSPDDRFWLFISEKVFNSSTWDILGIYHAGQLTGDWSPHARNPVVIDAIGGRPAGWMFRHNNRFFRPVQDNSRQYGDGMHLYEITELTPDTFQQRLIGAMDCRPYGGCHTYNHHHGLEVIDVFGRRVKKAITAVLTDQSRVFTNRIEPIDKIISVPSELTMV